MSSGVMGFRGLRFTALELEGFEGLGSLGLGHRVPGRRSRTVSDCFCGFRNLGSRFTISGIEGLNVAAGKQEKEEQIGIK